MSPPSPAIAVQLFTAKAIRLTPLIEGVNYYEPGKEGLIVSGPPST